jgi:hypothetical protein
VKTNNGKRADLKAGMPLTFIKEVVVSKAIDKAEGWNFEISMYSHSRKVHSC